MKVLWFAIGFVACYIALGLFLISIPSDTAIGTPTVATTTVRLPSGDFTYSTMGRYKYNSDGTLKWARSDPYTGGAQP